MGRGEGEKNDKASAAERVKRSRSYTNPDIYHDAIGVHVWSWLASDGQQTNVCSGRGQQTGPGGQEQARGAEKQKKQWGANLHRRGMPLDPLAAFVIGGGNGSQRGP